MTPQTLPPAPSKHTTSIAYMLWFVLFFPVGLWLMWRDPRAPLRLKQYVTGLVAIFILINGIYQSSPVGRAAQAEDGKLASATQAQANAQAANQAQADRAKHAAQAKADARSEAASQMEWKHQEQATESSLVRMRRDFTHGSNGDLISKVETGNDPYEARVTVKNEWFLRVPQIQLQSAQNLWAEWAQLRSPSNPGRAYIDIVDVNGNHVGGSPVDDGAAVKVNDQN